MSSGRGSTLAPGNADSWQPAHAPGPANAAVAIPGWARAAAPGAASPAAGPVTGQVTQPTPTASAQAEAGFLGMASGTWQLRQNISGARSKAARYGSSLADTRCRDAAHSRATSGW